MTAPYPQRVTCKPCLLPIVEATGAGCKTAVPILRANDDKRCALAAAADSYRIFSPLDPIHPWPLEGRLHHFARNDHGGHLLTVHLELGPGHGRLRRAWLLTIQEFCLAYAPGHEEDCDEGNGDEKLRHSSYSSCA